MRNKKRAFTLTELLVVVIVIGVLAAVVLPKFNKVIETRKTTEAEEIMAAVRTEQEQRCSASKRYTDDFGKLNAVITGQTTRHYTYSLVTGGGATAQSLGSYNYELRMPSFADGRICCEGEDCSRLNKDYPACAELTARADYMVDNSCMPPCEPTNDGQTSYTTTCGEGYSGQRHFQWDSSSCAYTETSNNCVQHECSENDTKIDQTVRCGCNNNGFAKYRCDNGFWGPDGCTISNACTCTEGATKQEGSCGCDGIQNWTCTNDTWVKGSCEGGSAVGEEMYVGAASGCDGRGTYKKCFSSGWGSTYEKGGYAVGGTKTASSSCRTCSDGSKKYKTLTCQANGTWKEGDCPSCPTSPNTDTPSNPCDKNCTGAAPRCCTQWGYTNGSQMYDENGNELWHNSSTGRWSNTNPLISSWQEGKQVFSFYYAAPPGSFDTSGMTGGCLQYATCRHYECDRCSGNYYCTSC